MFTEKDLKQFAERGTDAQNVERQIRNFETGFPYMEIIRPAIVGDGILQLSDDKIAELIEYYDNALREKKVLKFVPASGAASRMFKNLYEFLAQYDGKEIKDVGELKDQSFNSVANFITNLPHFAFFIDLVRAVSKDTDYQDESKRKLIFTELVNYLVTEKGLNYGNMPKGLLKFHKYVNKTRTPLEEHLVEAANYCTTGYKTQVHFTVSPEHRKAFEEHFEKAKLLYEILFEVEIEAQFSEQKLSTDTVAVDMNNKPFRDSDDSILFRPAGHGALIENLNDLDADVIFIKNIDNVVPDRLKDATYRYKKAIGSLLLQMQERIFGYLNELDETEEISDELMDEILEFIEEDLCVMPEINFDELAKTKKLEYIKNKLNRPLRVCGMVKNEGEPGGGPFWAINSDDTASLQIVESSQIDVSDHTRMTISKNATHFNPVDLVCAVKNYKSERFNLLQFIDPQTGFISKKSKDGKDLKAQEVPGLWNGAMSDWNTIFVEVPIITFNPVKTVNDLLRPEHQ